MTKQEQETKKITLRVRCNEMYCLHLQDRILRRSTKKEPARLGSLLLRLHDPLFDTEDGGSTLVRNVDNPVVMLHDVTALRTSSHEMKLNFCHLATGFPLALKM
jgi:predicted 2-oxoglutarate/Fe(II)-dependent dioxygenase YbiX